jgi:hypothetical protein
MIIRFYRKWTGKHNMKNAMRTKLSLKLKYCKDVIISWYINIDIWWWWRWWLLNINYNMAVGYKIYLHTNTDQLERHKYKMKSIRKTYSWLGKINMIRIFNMCFHEFNINTCNYIWALINKHEYSCIHIKLFA